MAGVARGVPQRWGYAGDLRSWLLTRAVAKPGGSVHQGAYYQALVQALGVPNGPLEAVLTPRACRRGRGSRAAGRARLGRPPAPGGRGAWRRVRHGEAVAAGTLHRPGAASWWAPTARRACWSAARGPDAATTAQVRAAQPPQLRDHVIDLAGATSLHALAGVLSLADACVSNDSGAMHVAAALGVPVVAIFGPTNEHETAPLARAAQSGARPDAAGGLPALYAAGVSDRPPVHGPACSLLTVRRAVHDVGLRVSFMTGAANKAAAGGVPGPRRHAERRRRLPGSDGGAGALPVDGRRDPAAESRRVLHRGHHQPVGGGPRPDRRGVPAHRARRDRSPAGARRRPHRPLLLLPAPPGGAARGLSAGLRVPQAPARA